jgi:hypothetical protein
MPTPKKVNPNPPMDNGDLDRSILDDIVPVDETGDDGLKVCIWGRMRTGKTRLACTFPKPLLLVGTQKGTKTVRLVPGVDFLRIREVAHLEVITDRIGAGDLKSYWNNPGDKWHKMPERKGNPYASVVLDTGGGYQDLVIKEMLGLERVPMQKSFGMGDKAFWGSVGLTFKEKMQPLIDLADDTGLNMVVIAHERSFDDEGRSSDVMVPSVGCALTPAAALYVNTECDYVVQCYIRKPRAEGDETSDDPVKPEYRLRLGVDGVHMVGARCPDGIVLPDYIVDPTFSKLLSLIQGKPLSKPFLGKVTNKK